jgi:hypothetical protein
LQEVRRWRGQPTPEIGHQELWKRDEITKQWNHEPPSFPRSIQNVINDALGIDDPPGQRRYPDVTLCCVKPNPDKPPCKVVIDLKFDRPSGGRDSWGTTPGKYSKQDQRRDYNDINEQCTGKKDLDLALDADVCECQKRKDDDEPEPVEDPAMLPLFPYAGKPTFRGKGTAPGVRAPGAGRIPVEEPIPLEGPVAPPPGPMETPMEFPPVFEIPAAPPPPLFLP